MNKLLAGIRVLTIEHFGAGPYGTQLLADLGAEVIKVENAATGGDVSRTVGPYYLGDNDSQYFQSFNRGKKSIVLDLKDAACREAFEKLVAEADAVTNNLRGDQPAKLRITYKDLQAINPAIVCAHISAYGRDNERAAWPGYDYLMQAECGFLDLTGEPGGPPARFGLSMVDFMTGTLMALALVAGVHRAKQTGLGCEVDTSLYETALHQLSYPAIWYLNEAHRTERLPRSSHPIAVPSQLFKTRDGWVFVMCQTARFWQLFCEKIDRREWLDDERFNSPAKRLANQEVLQGLIDDLLSEQDTHYWIRYLAGTIPVAPVNNIAEALDNPFAQRIGMLNTVEHPAMSAGLRMLSSPIRVNGARGDNRRAPALGENDKDYLA